MTRTQKSRKKENGIFGISASRGFRKVIICQTPLKQHSACACSRKWMALRRIYMYYTSLHYGTVTLSAEEWWALLSDCKLPRKRFTKAAAMQVFRRAHWTAARCEQDLLDSEWDLITEPMQDLIRRSRGAVEGKGPRRPPHRRLGRRLEEVANAVVGRLLSVTNAIEAGAWRQGDSGWAQDGGGGCPPPPHSNSNSFLPRHVS